MNNQMFILQRSKKLWTLKFSNGDSRDFPTQEAAERFCCKLGGTPTMMDPKKVAQKKSRPAKRKKRKSRPQFAMSDEETRRLRQFELSQKKGKVYGTASPKATLSASSFPDFVRVESGGAIETNRRKF